MRYLLFAILVFCPMALGQQNPNPVVDNVAIDGVNLTGPELEDYNRAAEARATALKNTKAFIENVVNWIDQTAPAVLQNQTERSRVETMRGDFILLGKRVLQAISATEVSGAVIRDKTLTEARDAKMKERDKAQADLAFFQAQENPDQATIAQAQADLDAVQAELDASESALANWKAAHPGGK